MERKWKRRKTLQLLNFLCCCKLMNCFPDFVSDRLLFSFLLNCYPRFAQCNHATIPNTGVCSQLAKNSLLSSYFAYFYSQKGSYK